MRNLKKFLALVLAMMMTLSLMVTVNAASDFTDKDSITENFAEGVEVLKGMGVFEGYPDGSFGPKGEITRAETAAIVYRLATGDWEGTQAHLYKDYQQFDDVASSQWFAGYINYCANAEWIAGYGNGKFGPNDKVTAYQAAAMILRAVGYGKNGEFVGSTWRTQVANVTRSEGLLVNVDKTTYANTMNNFATRELVAEILFQAAQIPTVTWSMLGGYNKYQTSVTVAGQDNLLNPSLGEKNYGLTNITGIVVGNQATGEGYTKLGMEVLNIWGNDAQTIASDFRYTRNGSYVYTTACNDGAATGNITLSFGAETGLDLFGHKTTIWFDYRSGGAAGDYRSVQYNTRYTKTYAAIDEATLTKTVWADDLVNDDKTANKTSVYTAAVAAGFSSSSAPAWESDRFCQIGRDADDSAIQSKVGMYRIISNNANKTADLVISLNQEVARITQRNSTVKDGEYIFLGIGNSRFGDVVSGTAGAGNWGGMLLDSLLAPGSDKTLGDLVTANEIVGTTWTGMTGDKEADGKNRTTTGAIMTDTEFFRYETSKLEPSFTGTVATYTAAENATIAQVTLSDGKSYDLSGITGSNLNTTNYPWNFDATYQHLVDNAIVTLRNGTISAGTTYSFYLDEVGRFVGVTASNEYEFLYTTFADYEVGGLGTGTISYYAYGVDWDGNIVKTNNQIKKITLPVDATNGSVFEDNTAYTPWVSGAGAAGYRILSGTNLPVGYNALPVTIKDQGSAVVGNQIKEGANTRFLMDGEGNLTWYPVTSAKNGLRFEGWYDETNSAVANTWTITAQDAKNGFVRVYDNTVLGTPTTGNNLDYLLTNSTKFVVVTGSGTADLSVKVYTGLTELLAGGTSADITYTTGEDNVYFITGEQRYGNVDTDANRTVDTVILSDTNLNQYGVQSLYFAAPQSEATGVKLAGDEASDYTINQYKLYSNGVASYYWVADDAPGSEPAEAGSSDTGAKDKDGTTNAGKGKFFTLTKIDEISGQPIYRAVEADPYANTIAGKNIDQVYNYIVVNNVNTADIGGTVFKVGDANVAEAYGENEPLIESNGIDTVEKLNHAVSMGKAGASGNLYEVHVAIVYDGIDVACIYVTNIVPST